MRAPVVIPGLAAARLREGETVVLPVRGHSMRPLLRRGDRITVKPLSIRELRCGDIAVVEQGKQLVAHRVHAIVPLLLLRGDSLRPLEQVSPVKLVGRVTAVQRARWRIRLDQPIGRFLSLACAQLGPVICRWAELRNRFLRIIGKLL